MATAKSRHQNSYSDDVWRHFTLPWRQCRRFSWDWKRSPASRSQNDPTK